MMNLYVISDLHISGPDDPLYASLLALMNRAKKGDVFVLAGDIFDLFVGNRNIFKKRYKAFFQALAELNSREVDIRYIEGNHDFLLHKTFLDYPRVKLYPKDFSLELKGKRFYLAHGDLVNPMDLGYRILRAFFRSPLMRAFIFFAPESWVDAVGKYSSDKSGKTKPRLPAELPTSKLEQLRKLYRNYAVEKLTQGYDFIIMGHCHDLDEKTFHLSGRSGQYINVGFPRAHGSFLSWSPGEAKIQRERMPREG